MCTLPLAEVKSHLSELMGRVHDHHERVTRPAAGRGWAGDHGLADGDGLVRVVA